MRHFGVPARDSENLILHSAAPLIGFRDKRLIIIIIIIIIILKKYFSALFLYKIIDIVLNKPYLNFYKILLEGY